MKLCNSRNLKNDPVKQCARQPIGKTFVGATVIFAISRFSSRFVTFLSFCAKIGILSTPNLVQSSYGRNRFGGVVWPRDDAAHAMGKLTNDNDYWYDGLYQVQQHERGQLKAYLTGITSPVQSENFTFDEMDNSLQKSSYLECRQGYHKIQIWVEERGRDFQVSRQANNGCWYHHPGDFAAQLGGNPASQYANATQPDWIYKSCGMLCIKSL